MKMREEVRALSLNWVWGEEKLRYAGIEATSKVKERMVTVGRYRPKVSKAQAGGAGWGGTLTCWGRGRRSRTCSMRMASRWSPWQETSAWRSPWSGG